MISAQDFAAFIRADEGLIAVRGAGGYALRGFAHYEDASPGDICWHRTNARGAFHGSVILLDREHPPAVSALTIVHQNPRMLAARIIEKFFVDQIDNKLADVPGELPNVLLNISAQNYDADLRPLSAVGTVRVEEDVTIGAFTTIARGMVGNTTIHEGCRIGQHVNIGHDCRIGPRTVIVAGAMLAGWVRVGERCRIDMGARIRNGVAIGDGARIGMGAVVVCDIPAGETWAGNPAKRVAKRINV